MNPNSSEDDQPTVQPRSSDTPPASDAPTIAPNQPSIPKPNSLMEFDDYELIEEIARGGMGVVYRARQKSLNREVAVKMILAGQFASTEDVERFHTEAEAAARLDHAAIVPIYEIGEFEGHHYFSMKLIDGGSLSARLNELRNNLPRAIEIFEEVSRAVHHAHQRGILHRDLKPANILIDSAGQAFVTDLGLARRVDGNSQVTQTGAVMGTPSYMSPEQAAGNRDITTASDVYSLGAILYEILTGKPPFKANTSLETMMQVVGENPAPPSSVCKTDRGLESICMKCLAREPSDRYATAGDLAADLRRWLNGEPVTVRSQSVLNTTRFWMKQNFGRAAWALVVGPLFGFISGMSFWYATIQSRVDQSLETLREFKSVETPLVFISGFGQKLLSPLFLIAFAFTIVFIGFFTAVLVKPKNRGADLAAGAVVGFFAMLTAFVFCFAPLNVLTSVDPIDLVSISELVKSEQSETPKFIIDQYPELATLSRDEQVDLLARKARAEYIFQVPKGIWLGLIMSLGLYFIPSLFETWAAGAILRKHKTWWRAFLPYLEAAFPVVTCLTLVGIIFACWITSGTNGILIGTRIVVMLLLVFCAIITRIKHWPIALRVVLNIALSILFVFLLVYDFRYIPGVVHFRTTIRKAEALAEQSGGISEEISLADKSAEFANFLQSIGQYDRAKGLFDEAEERLKAVESTTESEEKQLAEGIRDLQIHRVLFWERAGQNDEAIKLLDDLQLRFPNGQQLQSIRERMESVTNE